MEKIKIFENVYVDGDEYYFDFDGEYLEIENYKTIIEEAECDFEEHQEDYADFEDYIEKNNIEAIIEKNAIENYLEEIDNETEILRNIANEVNSYNGALDVLQYYDFDEYFFDLFDMDKMEIMRATVFGEVCWSDEYIRLNVYGNFETINSYEFDKLIDSYKDVILSEAYNTPAYFSNDEQLYIDINKRADELEEV